jgi:undecaprenyl-phosphate 4-deoxy-4-formamido-L-arabinose transferase
MGFFFTLFGVGVLAWVVGRYLIHGQAVPGFAFIASIIAIFSGAQMFTLGIFGEYLARMYGRAMERPAYVVLERCNHEQQVGEARPQHTDSRIIAQ